MSRSDPCVAVRETISAAVDGEVGPVPIERLAGHLFGCPSCASFRDDAMAVDALLRQPIPATTPGARSQDGRSPAVAEGRSAAASSVAPAVMREIAASARQQRRQWLRRRAPIARWLPAGALALAIPLLAAVPPHAGRVSSHAESPCTHELAHERATSSTGFKLHLGTPQHLGAAGR